MPRTPRARTKSGIHHIVVQGVRNRNIFFKDENKDLYLDILLRYRARFEMEIYAYCILENHCHILLKEGLIDVSSFMRRVGVSYSYWYKKREEETGAIFRGRYLSEPLEEGKLADLIRFIHEEPVERGLVQNPEEYIWSSARRYQRQGAFYRREFESVCAEEQSNYGSQRKRLSGAFLEEVPSKFGKSLEEAEEALQKRLGERGMEELPRMSMEERNNLLWQLRYEDDISIQLVSRITGIGRGVIQRIRR